jgi:hypothetical protein
MFPSTESRAWNQVFPPQVDEQTFDCYWRCILQHSVLYLQCPVHEHSSAHPLII